MTRRLPVLGKLKPGLDENYKYVQHKPLLLKSLHNKDSTCNLISRSAILMLPSLSSWILTIWNEFNQRLFRLL